MQAICPAPVIPPCDPVCEERITKPDKCGCEQTECVDMLCEEPKMPDCPPCMTVMNETNQCGCLSLKCVPQKCPVTTPAPCKECERSEEIKGPCNCSIFRCVAVNFTQECVINGISHKIGSSWPNQFDPKCSSCKCVDGGKCLGAKIECEPVATKDCVVFCKEGEWYFPPSKEQCADTCGPCCGKCRQGPCNAESGAVTPEKTIGLLKMNRAGRGRGLKRDVVVHCTNKEIISNLKRCSGTCGLAHTQTWTPLIKHSSCKCCEPSEMEEISVRMTCDDDTHYTQIVKNPKGCKCQPCGLDKGGKK